MLPFERHGHCQRAAVDREDCACDPCRGAGREVWGGRWAMGFGRGGEGRGGEGRMSQKAHQGLFLPTLTYRRRSHVIRRTHPPHWRAQRSSVRVHGHCLGHVGRDKAGGDAVDPDLGAGGEAERVEKTFLSYLSQRISPTSDHAPALTSTSEQRPCSRRSCRSEGSGAESRRRSQC